MENLSKRPSKGILRFSEGSSRSNSVEKDFKWDETNIKETLHPEDKDYGFMHIDEPPTPYSRGPGVHSDENSEDEDDMQRKTSDLLQRVSKKIKEPPVTIEDVVGGSSTSDDFELKRKRHYNEFHAVQLAKKLMEQEQDEDEEEDDEAVSGGKEVSGKIGRGREEAMSQNDKSQ